MSGRTWAVRQVVETWPITVTSDDETLPSTMLAQWDEHDPAAVLLVLADPWSSEERLVEWVVGRNLLVAAHLPGLAGEVVGRGDARVVFHGGETTLAFTTPEGSCSVKVAGEHLVTFLRQCAAYIPLGGIVESSIYADQIDREFAAMTGRQS